MLTGARQNHGRPGPARQALTYSELQIQVTVTPVQWKSKSSGNGMDDGKLSCRTGWNSSRIDRAEVRRSFITTTVRDES